MKTTHRRTRSLATLARIARRRLVVRVRPLALAAAVALGSPAPWVMAQTVITPLQGAGQTATVVSTQGNQTTVSTQSLRDGNAFSTYSRFQVGQGDVVQLAVPQGANWWVNIVRDQRVRVDGRLESRLLDGRIGGNILFVDSHGFAVGPSGQVDVGRLTFAAPSTTFVDGLLAGGGVMSGAAVGGLLAGQFELSATGAVDIRGRVSARDGVSLMAGHGADAQRAVSITGQVVVQGRVAGSAVNLGDLKSLTPLQDRDGVIDITTPGSITLDGVLISDSSHWRQAGAVRVLAGQDIAVGANAYASASGAVGSGAAGGQVTLFAQRDIANTPGATLRARGDGAGAGGAIEYSGLRQLNLSGMRFDAGSDTGAAGLVFVDPDDAVVQGINLTGGAHFVYGGDDTMTVRSGAVINTRKVASGADATNASVASTGDSGNIVLKAPRITVQAGALLDASVVNAGGSSHQAGDITLTAENSSSWVTLLGLANADASIDVAGTLKGRNVTLLASIESSAVYDGVSAALTEKGISLLAESLGSPLALSLAYTEATGNATVNVRGTAVLAASQDLRITALADRSAGAELQVGGSSAANLSAGFARIAGTTSVDVASGAQLSAGEDIALVAASKTSIGMTSAAAGETDDKTGAANVASVVFAGSLSDVSTRVNVAAGAALTSGGSTEAQAFHSGHYETSAEVTVYGGGTAGVVGALSLQTSTTSAELGGTVHAGGDVRVTALNAVVKNSISATAETAQKAPDEELKLPESLELSTDDAKQELQLGFLAMAEKLSATSEEASGGSAAESKPSALKLAGAMTWSESNHTTRASLGAGAQVRAGGHAVVDAQTLVGQLQSVALSEAASETEGKDASKVALSVAFNYANHQVSTRAQLGAGATVDAAQVAVNAATDIPEFYSNGLPLDWSSFSSAYANLVGGTSFLLDGFNTRVGSTAAGKTLAAAGAVNLTFMKNDTRAWVDTGAKITTTVSDGLPWSYDIKEVGFDSDLVEMLIPPNTYTLDKDLGVLGDFVSTTREAPAGPAVDEIRFTRSFSGSTVVRAQNNVQTLHHAGGDAPEAGGTGTSVGGTFSMVDRRNTAIAGIADRAEITTQRLDVNAQTTDWLITISPTSGKGAGVAANGIASYNKLHETTVASISREALVTAPTVNVEAQLSLGVIAITGAVSRSENSGVGIGLALNEMTGDTRAYVGDNDTDGGGPQTAEGAAGAIRTGALSVRARTDGMAVAVGVAGASAGEEPDPAEPASPSTGDNLAAQSGTQSADAQRQLDGSGATLAPVAQASEPAKGTGSDAAASQEPEASKPPSISIAGAGAIVTNFSDLDTTALIDRAVVSGIGAGSSTVAVRALSDLTQVSVAGGGALSLSRNASTKFSAAIAGAVAIQNSDDDTTARIVGSTISDLADQSGSLVVQALKSGERTAVATGMSANLSKGSTTSVSVAGSASVTTSTDDTLASVEDSAVSGRDAAPTALGVQVVAYDRSRIGAGGGALSVSTGKGAAGVGAAISVVNAKGSTQAQVSGGSITRAHDLAVLALSSQKVVSVAAVGGVQTDASSKGQLMGSFVYNHIGNSLSASVTKGAVVNLTGDLALQAGGALGTASLDALLGAVRASDVTDYEMASASNGYTSEFKNAVGGESIVGVAGTLSVTLGNNASSLGLSYVHNDIQTTYKAELNGSVTAAGGVTVEATSRADIVGVSAGVGATKGQFSGMGSASVNLIGQRTQAAVSGGSVNAARLDVLSSTTGNLFGLAGNLSFAVGGGQGKALGAAVAVTQTGTKTYTGGGASTSTRAAGNAASIDAAQVNVGSGRVQVQATNVSDLQSVAASGAVADGNVGFAGTVTVNDLGDVTEARMGSSTVTAGSVRVQAGEGQGATSAQIRSLAGGVSASKGYSGALALGFNTIESTRSAQILSSTINAGSAVSVLADAGARIQTLSVTLAGGKDYALAGSSSANRLSGSTLSQVSGTTLSGAATALTVHASQSGTIESLAGSVSGGGTGAIGGAVAVNLMGAGAKDFKVTARVSDTTLAAPVAVSVDARLSGSIGSVAASGSGAGTAAINGSVTANTIEADVVAEVSGGSQSVSGDAFSVQARNDASIASLAGTISGAGTAAVGAAVSVNEIGGNVLARVNNHAMRATGAVAVGATSSGTIRSVAAGMSGGGTVGLAGSNTTNAITSTVQASLNNVTQQVASSSLAVLARDTSTIQSFAGSVAGGGTAGGGAALALNFLGRTATDAASRKVVKAEVVDSVVRSTGAAQVQADSTSVIESIGVAAGLSGTTAISGSNATNRLEDAIAASWSGSDFSGSGALTVGARQAAQIRSLAGNVSGSGGASVGAAVAVNRIGSQTSASLVGVTNARFNNGTGPGSIAADDLLLSAESDNQIDTIAVGMAAGTVGVQGSVAVSVISSQTHATLGADAHVTSVLAQDSVAVTAHSRDRIRALAGAVGLGAAGVGAAGGVLTNVISSSTSAGITGADTQVNALAHGSGLSVRTDALASSPNLMNIQAVSDAVLADARLGTRTVKGLAVQATSIQQIGALTAVVGGGALGAAGAAVNVDQIGGSTRAYIDRARFINDRAGAAAGQASDVMAANHALVASSVTAAAFGGVGVSGAVGSETISRSTRAEVLDGAVVHAQGAASVKAVSSNTVAQIAAGAAGGATAGVAGSGDVVLMQGETVALVDGARISADRISVVADGANRANLIAGSVGGGGAVGVGLSFTVAVSGSTVRAVVNNSALAADGAVVVDADNRTESLSVSASAAAGGTAGVAVGASVTVMEGATEAAVKGQSSVGRRTVATGVLASANDAPVSINLASAYDAVGTGNQSDLRFSLNALTGRVAPDDAVVTVTDGVRTVTAVRQADGSYAANVAALDDGVLLAQVVLREGGVQKVSTTTLLKSTGKIDADAALVAANLPAAQTRIATLSSFEQVDARNHGAVQFVLKSDAGLTADGAAAVIVSDGTRQVSATRNADGSYTADVRSLGDGVLTALVTTPAGGTATARLTFVKASGAASLSVTANEVISLNHNAGQVGAGGVAGVGASANVVVGKSTVDATVNASSIRVSGALAVSAERDADIDMITATGGGGGFVGVSGAVGVLVFGAAPDSNANSELTGSKSTLGLVGGATQANRAQGTGGALSSSETTALNTSAKYDTQGAYGGASGRHRTSATLGAQSVVAGSLSVKSLDRTVADNNAGAVAAGGAAGVSAGVAVTLLGGANHAGVSVGDMAVAGHVTVDAGTRSSREGASVSSRAVAGAGGFVGVGAAVSVASNSTANTAVLAGQLQAGGALSVRALDESSMSSEAYGATAGVLSVGVVTATATQSGSVATTLSGVHGAQGLSAVAERDAAVNAIAVGGSAGVVAGSGAGATASDSGAVSLNLASGLVLDAGQGTLALAARANPSARTQAVGVAVAKSAAVGVSVALSTVSTAVDVTAAGPVTLRGADVRVAAVLGAGASSVNSQASAGAGALLLGATGAGATSTNVGRARVNLGAGVTLGTTGDVTLSATDSMALTASAVGVGAGFVGLGVAVSEAVSNTTVAAHATGVQGRVGGSLQVSASGNESIDSNAVAGSGGVVAGAGARSTVDHDQTVAADLGVATGQTLVVEGRTTVDASRTVRYDSRTTAVNAAALGASGAVTRATLDGSATARLLDGSRLDARSLRVLATNDLARTQLGAQSAVGGGGGVVSGAGADVFTRLTGDATARIGNNATVLLEDLLEVRAYNEMHGSSRAQMDVGGAVPIALVNTEIQGQANADAVIGSHTNINVYGESAVNALSYVNLEAHSVSKTYGLAAAAQGNAHARADVNNRVTVGAGSQLRSTEDMSLLAGQDLDFNRNKHFVTARVDLFNHSAIPVSINPDADATLNLNNALVVNANAIRSGGTIKLGGVEGTSVVEGKGKVSDWTRDLGELVGLSSDYGSSRKNLRSTAVLNGEVEAGFGNKQRLVVGVNGSILESEGDVRYTITNEDLSASASAYVERLYDQLARYGDVPEVRAFVEAELSFYFATLLKEGLAEELTMNDGSKVIVASSGVAANFLNIKNLRAGSGNIELFGNDVSGTAALTARADSEIYIENRSPLNLRVFDMVVDANGGFAKYNGTYLMSNADIGTLNKTTKTTGLSVDSIDTRGGGSAQLLPKLTVKNTYVPTGAQSGTPVVMTAPDGTWADLREDQVRAPELRVNGWLYNKLGTLNLSNTAGSISVYAEDPAYVPRLDAKEIAVAAGKNFVLSSPTISQSVGGSPESLYAVHYSTDQQTILNNLGITACGSARPGGGAATYDANCVVNGAGGVYATGAIFIGARYLNINGTVQSGQADYNVVLSNATVGTQITNWRSTWLANRGTYLAQGRSSLIQLSGPLPTDSEAEINKRYANGTITASARATALSAMATRRQQPIVFYDAEANVLKVAPTNVQGGLVELVGSIINTGGGVVRALDGYARINIDNQTAYGLDLQGLDTGGEAGVIRITDLNKPIKNADGSIKAYQVTTYQRDTDGVFKAKVTEGTGVGATLISTSGSLIGSPSGSVKARFNYSPLANSTYSWSAGYEFMTEKRYYLKTSSWLGFIPGASTNWNSVDTYVKTANAMVEDVYVGTNRPVGGGSFSITTQRVTTDAEKQIYYRSWSKCGFLCIKKTYYVDRRTEVGLKDIFTQRVKADHNINIELVGYDTGVLNVKSVGGIRLGGNITNASGTVSLQSTNGAISQLNSGAVVEGVNLTFLAKTGIGTEAAPINLITGTGSFTAESQSGPIAVHGNSGALRINRVSTTGNVWLDGDDSIVGLTPGAVHVKGHRIYLAAPKGSIGEFNANGTVKSTLNIDSGDATSGGLSAYSRNGVAIKEMTGNLWVDQVATGGDVYLEAPGDLIDNNRNETRDERTEAELLSLWDQAALQGTSAEASRQLTLTTTRAQFRRYWSLRDVRNVVTDAQGNVTSYEADPIGADYRYRFDAELRQQYLSNGVSEAQIAAMEAAQTAEVLKLHAEYGTTVYQTGNEQVIAAVNAANLARGKPEVGALAEWTDAELKSPLPKAVFSKSSTDTQTRIEEPNVVGNRVVLRPGGQIGRDDGQLVIPLLSADRIRLGLAAELTADERLAIMSAESDDMSLDKATWTLTVVKKDTFNVLSNRLNVNANGFVYLGADTTERYPNGGSANLEMVKGTGEIRIKVSDSILSVAAAGVSVIQGQKAILEAAQGSIGSAARPVQIALANNSTGTLTARASEGLWIHSVGDLRAADIFTPGSAHLSASGSIIDARPVVNFPNDGDRTVRSIEARDITLNAQGGSVGSGANPMVLKVGADGVNATSALGYSIYLQPSEGADLVLRSVNSGLDVEVLSPYGHLVNLSAVTARRSIYAEAAGDITGLMYTAGADVVLAAGGNMTGSKVAAGSGTASLSAGGTVSLTSLTSNRDVVVSAGGAISLTSGSAGRDLGLTSQQGGIKAVTLRAGNSLLATAWGDQGDLRVTTVTATAGALTLHSAGELSVSLASAAGAVEMRAVRGMSLLNVTSTGAGLTLVAGGEMSMLAARARTAVSLAAGAGVRAASLTSSAGAVSVTADAGELNAQTVTAAQGVTLTATGGDVRVGTAKTTAGGLALTSGGAMAVSAATAAGLVQARAGGSADLKALTSSGAGVDVASTQGALKVGTATAKTLFKADAAQGALTVGSFTAATADLDAGTSLAVTGTGRTTGAMAMDSDGSMALGTLTATGGAITARAEGAMTAKAVTATVLNLQAGNGLNATKLVSTAGNVGVSSLAGLLRVGTATAKTLFKADAGAGALTVGSFTAASADLDAGTSLAVTGTGRTTGAMTMDSDGSMALGTLTSTGGAITALAGGAMTAKTLQAAGALGLQAGTGLKAGALTSTSSSVQVGSDAGAVTVTSATARTRFEAISGGGLSVSSFTVSMGGAVLRAGGTTTLSKGTASQAITVTSRGNAALGTLTSSASTITATSTGGGLTFATLKAGTGIQLDAAKAWSVGQAISGTALTVTRGVAEVLARAGHITVGTLSVGTLASTPKSTLTTQAGSIKVGKVVGLKPDQLVTVATGGTKTLPKGYQ